MTRLLRVDASARTAASHARDTADAYLAGWRTRNPGGEIVVRDLAADPVPHIAEATIKGFYAPAGGMTPALERATALSDRLIAEVMAADELLIATPMDNFSVPSALKAWIDQIVRINRTFAYDGRSFTGLVTGKYATVVAAYGAAGYGPSGALAAANFLDPYLAFLLRFIGIEAVTHIPIEATTADAETIETNRRAARDAIERSLASLA